MAVSSRRTKEWLTCFALLLSGPGGCATKVENPAADDDQEGAELLSMPTEVVPFKLPVNVQSFEGIDPLYRPVILQMLAVSELATNASGTMNQFFTALASHQLKKNGSKEIASGGKTFLAKSWTTPTATGFEAGAYFCLDGAVVGYFKWGEPALPVEYLRSLKTELLIADPPLLKGLDGMLSSTFALDGSRLDSNYSGLRRNVESYEDETNRAVMQFVARRHTDGRYGFSGSSVNLDDAGLIPASGDVRAYGDFTGEGIGSVLLHLDGLCPAFDEANADDPSWCLGADVTQNKVAISEKAPLDVWKEIKRDEVPLPKHELLKFVAFKDGLSCTP